MAQSDKEKIEELEQKLACLSYRLEDLQKEWEARIKALESTLKPIDWDEAAAEAKVQMLGKAMIEKMKMRESDKFAGYATSYKHDGHNCSCSPVGMPHSRGCKGYNKGPSYEDITNTELNIDQYGKVSQTIEYYLP